MRGGREGESYHEGVDGSTISAPPGNHPVVLHKLYGCLPKVPDFLSRFWLALLLPVVNEIAKIHFKLDFI